MAVDFLDKPLSATVGLHADRLDHLATSGDEFDVSLASGVATGRASASTASVLVSLRSAAAVFRWEATDASSRKRVGSPSTVGAIFSSLTA